MKNIFGQIFGPVDKNDDQERKIQVQFGRKFSRDTDGWEKTSKLNPKKVRQETIFQDQVTEVLTWVNFEL